MMYMDITLKKGLNIPLKGEAKKEINTYNPTNSFAIYPKDFHGITPKLTCKEGDEVFLGQPLFYSKSNPEIMFVSPSSGRINKIVRGARRKILSIEIIGNKKKSAIKHNIPSFSKITPNDIKKLLLSSGCWPFIKQRPYDIVADPNLNPKSIFISALSTAPLVADVNFSLQGKEDDFKLGIKVLNKLTKKINLCVSHLEKSFLNEIDGVEIHKINGKHPAGNVGVQIHHIDPINKGEIVWVINPQDVALIGSFFKNGEFNPRRTIAMVGPAVKFPSYFKVLIGSSIKPIVEKAGVESNSPVRIINGNVLTGNTVGIDENIGFYNDTISLLKEGNYYRMFGWLPFTGSNIFSMSRTSLSWLMPKKTYSLDTNMNGEERALVVTGEMEKVMPMDILPMQLLKECMAENIDKMEALGIYEVAPEDFALIDYTSSSKIEAQEIIRDALDLMINEVG